MAQEWEAERPARLEDLLSREWPKSPEALAELSRVETEELAFLRRMRELARGLVGSEYWELVNLVLISDMETAKAALEESSTSDKDLRVNQGAAKALRSVRNFLVVLAKTEEQDGEESNRLFTDES